MALNWEKLSKLQRDYPKPKFALDAVNKLLKKRNDDPYLSAWKVDLCLQLNYYRDLPQLVYTLKLICQRQPPVTDTDLLAYVYKLLLEATRRSNVRNLSLVSVGEECLKAWQNAAKSLRDRRARLHLWSELFVCAMREDCWEDVRMAVSNAKNESTSKKAAHFSLILACQLVGEEKVATEEKNTGKVGTVAKLQLNVAHGLMKKAYEQTSKDTDDVIRVEDMRDLRFMAQIFQRQGRHAELFKLWDNPPLHLRELMEKHSSDIMVLKVHILKEQKDWVLLKEHCLHSIDKALQETDRTKSSESLTELSSRAWDLWGSFLDAIKHTCSESEAIEQATSILNRCYEARISLSGRGVDITRMALYAFVRQPVLQLCKDFWSRYSTLSSCFHDLLPVVKQLSPQEQSGFHKFINETSKSSIPAVFDTSETSVNKWLQTEINVLRFSHTLIVKTPTKSSFDHLETFVGNALKLCHTGSQIGGDCYYDAGYLAIIGLLHLHHKVQEPHGQAEDKGSEDQEDETSNRYPLPGVTPNARILLQAAVLARHLTAGEVGKQNRILLLLSTRLHLNLGLGTIAFQQYNHTKVKEMLVDTVSLILLAGISQTHPFDVTGPKAFSADRELASAISTIERMESRVDDFLYVDTQSFQYDQAIELLKFKRKLRSSLTKHVCIVERRRIARLRGDVADDQLLDLDLKDHQAISDNTDLSIFPDVGSSEELASGQLFIQNGFPDRKWLYGYLATCDRPCRLLYKEKHVKDTGSVETWLVDKYTETSAASDDQAEPTALQQWAHMTWCYLSVITWYLFEPEGGATLKWGNVKENFGDLQAEIEYLREVLDKLTTIDALEPKLENEPTIFHENMLTMLYGSLEVLRTVWKLCDKFKDIFKKNRFHPLKATIKKAEIDELEAETVLCYDLITAITRSNIDRLKSKGAASIVAQVRWGPTGAALRQIISDDDLNFYAKEYVESAIEAFSGVLKVKLK